MRHEDEMSIMYIQYVAVPRNLRSMILVTVVSSCALVGLKNLDCCLYESESAVCGSQGTSRVHPRVSYVNMDLAADI